MNSEGSVKNGQLSVEQILEQTYGKPCRRVLPGSASSQGFAYGSQLITASEVVIVCNPEDAGFFPPEGIFVDGVVYPDNKLAFGYLPGSRLVLGRMCFTVVDRDRFSSELFRWNVTAINEQEIPFTISRGERKGMLGDVPNSAGSLRTISCPEEMRLLGKRAAEEFFQVLNGSGCAV